MASTFERVFTLTREGLESDPKGLRDDPGLELIRKETEGAFSQTLTVDQQIAALLATLGAHSSVQVHAQEVWYEWVWVPNLHRWIEVCHLSVSLTIADPGVKLAILRFQDNQELP
jgi:hypothetical protein